MVSIVETCLSFACLFWVPFLEQDGPSKRIEFGGPRNVIAQLTKRGDDLEVAVDMLAVGCFDVATNKKLSHEKAIRYVHLAIADYLEVAGKKSSTMSLSGMSTKSASFVKNRFHLTVVFPFPASISIEGTALATNRADDSATTDKPMQTAAAKTTQEAAPRKRPSLHPADDFVETSQFLLISCNADIPTLPDAADDVGRAAFYGSIADLEEQAEKDFEALCKEVQGCKLLLSIEVEDILRTIRADRDKIDEALGHAAASLQDPPKDN